MTKDFVKKLTDTLKRNNAKVTLFESVDDDTNEYEIEISCKGYETGFIFRDGPGYHDFFNSFKETVEEKEDTEKEIFMKIINELKAKM